MTRKERRRQFASSFRSGSWSLASVAAGVEFAEVKRRKPVPRFRVADTGQGTIQQPLKIAGRFRRHGKFAGICGIGCAAAQSK
jgi:hypothetical protein